MSDVKDFYDSTAHNYDKRHDNPTTKYMRHVEDKLIRKYAHGLVLDIGCGAGAHLGLLNNAVGLDISRSMLKEARNKTDKSLIQARAENLPFSDNYFDSIICMFTVLNLCDYDAAAKEMHRVLKPGGTAVVSVASVWDRLDKKIWQKARDVRSISKNVRIEGHRLTFHLFGRKDFIDLFRSNGFRKIDFHSLFTMQKPYWGWYRSFSLWEKLKLKADYFVPHRAGRIYIGVFQKQ